MKSNRFKFTLHTSKGQFEELVDGESVELGRNIAADLPVMANGVSRSHLKIYVKDKSIMIKDLGSTNGTYIKGERVEPHKDFVYESGSRVSLGQAGCFVRIEIVDQGVKIKENQKSFTQITFANQKAVSETQVRSSIEETGIIGGLFGKRKNSDDLTDVKGQKRAQKYMDQAEKLVKKRIAEAESSIRKGIQKARIQAKDIVTESRKEADTIRAKAQVEKNKMLAELEDEMSSQQIALQKKLSDENIENDAQNQILRQEIEASRKEADVLLKGVQKEVEKLELRKKQINEEINRFLEKKNKAREAYKEVEVKLSTIDEKHEAKVQALELELSFLKQELSKQQQSLESVKSEQDIVLKSQKNALENLSIKSEEAKDVLESATLKLDETIEKHESLKKSLNDVKVKLKSKRSEFTKNSKKVDLLLVERDRLEDDLIKTKENSDQHLKTLKEQAESSVKEIRKKALEETDQLIQEAKARKTEAFEQSKLMETKALEEKQDFLKESKELKKEALVLRNKAQSDYDSKMKDFEDFKSAEILKLEENFKEKKIEAQSKLEKELAESKVSQIRLVEKDVEEQKRILHTYRAEYAESWSQSIVFKAEELFGKDLTELQKEEIREKLKSYTKSIIMEEDPGEESEVQSLMKFDPKHREKVKKFWKRSALVAVMGLFALIVSPYVTKSLKRQAQAIAEKSSEDSDKRVAKFEEERDRLKTYVPEKRESYLSSYTDRVLYTSKYVENELSKDYRENWFLDLDTFFVEELILSDETIVTFISKETNLIKDLKDLREGINAQFLDEGIKRMRDLEQKFVFEVKGLLKTEGKYKQFENFKEKTYLKAFPFSVERGLATETK